MYLLLLLLLRALLNLFNLLQFLQRLSFPRFDLVLFLLLGFQIYVVSHRFGHQFFRRLLWRFRAIAIATRFTTVIIIGRLCTNATFRRRRRRRRRRIHRRFLPLRFFLLSFLSTFSVTRLLSSSCFCPTYTTFFPSGGFIALVGKFAFRRIRSFSSFTFFSLSIRTNFARNEATIAATPSEANGTNKEPEKLSSLPLLPPSPSSPPPPPPFPQLSSVGGLFPGGGGGAASSIGATEAAFGLNRILLLWSPFFVNDPREKVSFEAPHLFTTFSREGGGEDEDEDEIVEKFVPIVIVAIIISSLLRTVACVITFSIMQSVQERGISIQFAPISPNSLIKSKKLNEWWWCRSNATFFIVINHVLTNLRATKREYEHRPPSNLPPPLPPRRPSPRLLFLSSFSYTLPSLVRSALCPSWRALRISPFRRR